MTEKKKQQNQRQMSEMTSQNTTKQPVNMVKRPNKTQNEWDKLFAIFQVLEYNIYDKNRKDNEYEK